MSFRKKLSILIGLLFLTAVLNVIFTFELERHGEKKLNWVNHTHEVLITIENLLSALKDAETGQRGFLLTDNPSYLEPYHTGRKDVAIYFKKLREITSDNPTQQQALISIENNINLKLDELEETIQLSLSNKKQDALELVNEDIGKQYMDRLRSEITEFSNAELILLEKRKGDFRENRAQITTLILVEIFLFIAVAIFTFTFLQKQLFQPIQFLLNGAKKIESGSKVELSDITQKDEMGRLLSTFYDMSHTVFSREKELSHIANHDELTGLYNRRALYEYLNLELSRAKRTNDSIAVIYFDINGFKKVNDQKGHIEGDKILKSIADIISKEIRDTDIGCRYGGDEFCIILGSSTCDDAHTISDRIIKTCKNNYLLSDISLSIGIASTGPNHYLDANDLVSKSDSLMYISKNKSKQNFGYYITIENQTSKNVDINIIR